MYSLRADVDAMCILELVLAMDMVYPTPVDFLLHAYVLFAASSNACVHVVVEPGAGGPTGGGCGYPGGVRGHAIESHRGALPAAARNGCIHDVAVTHVPTK